MMQRRHYYVDIYEYSFRKWMMLEARNEFDKKADRNRSPKEMIPAGGEEAPLVAERFSE